jgi:hypothetical protein
MTSLQTPHHHQQQLRDAGLDFKERLILRGAWERPALGSEMRRDSHLPNGIGAELIELAQRRSGDWRAD